MSLQLWKVISAFGKSTFIFLKTRTIAAKEIRHEKQFLYGRYLELSQLPEAGDTWKVQGTLNKIEDLVRNAGFSHCKHELRTLSTLIADFREKFNDFTNRQASGSPITDKEFEKLKAHAKNRLDEFK